MMAELGHRRAEQLGLEEDMFLLCIWATCGSMVVLATAVLCTEMYGTALMAIHR
jgi:hypothetical protein